MAKKIWTPTDISNPIETIGNVIEFQDDKGEYHDFIIVATIGA